MKILLTGHKGYIGSHLHPHLESLGNSVVGVDRAEMDEQPKVIGYDIRSGAYDVVIHCGAISDSQFDDPGIFSANYHNANWLAHEVHNSFAARLIFFSSIMARDPTTWYGWSKNCAEYYIRLLMKLQTAVVRPCQVFGGHERDGHKSLPRKLIDGEAEHLFADYYRDYIHVNDVCRAICFIIEKDLWGQTYDLGTSNAVSSYDLSLIKSAKNAELVDPETILKFRTPSYLIAHRDALIPGFKPEIDVKDWMRNELKVKGKKKQVRK